MCIQARRFPGGKRPAHLGRPLGGLIWTLLLALAARGIGAEQQAGGAASRQWNLSSNFAVVSAHPEISPEFVTRQCEELRTLLQSRWLSQFSSREWSPRCEVVVHHSETDYLEQVGWQAAMTRGCCRIDVQQGRIVRRRLDLVADSKTFELTALAHELTHVVLADRFVGRPIPRWADEGMALLADRDRKRTLHLRNLHQALEQNRCPKLRDVLDSHRYPPGPQLSAFYGQSLSMVSFLSERGEPAKVVELVALAMERGYDEALRTTYGIDGAAEFERQWREYARRDDSFGVLAP
jgi:hypothetical protein